METLKKIKWGIIGCGNVTEIKSGPAFQSVENSELISVMRRNAELARDYALRHNVPNWTDSADTILNDGGIDAVYIAAPPSAHKEYTLRAAEAGKHVYVEKPMALNYSECREMIDACEKNKVKLFTAFYRRGLPKFNKIKKIAADEIGTVRAVNSILTKPISERDTNPDNWRVIPEISGGGYFHDLAPHTIDILLYFFGSVRYSTGYSVNQAGIYKADDSASLLMQFESGIQFSGIWNFASHKNIDRTEIIGDKGKLTFSTFKELPVILENDSGRREFLIKNPKHIQQPLIQTIVDDILGKGKCPSTGRTGAETSKILDSVISIGA